MAATEIKSLAEQKRELLERSQQYRAALAADCVEVGASLSWLPRTLQLVKTISPLLVVAAPLAGWFVRKKMRNGKTKPAQHNSEEKKKKAGLFALAWQGFRLYRQVAPFVQGFLKAWPATRPAQPAMTPQQAHVRARSERA